MLLVLLRMINKRMINQCINQFAFINFDQKHNELHLSANFFNGPINPISNFE